MAGPSTCINLDSLISELDEDKALVLKISDSVPNSDSDRNDDSGSDSSYGKLAKNVALGLERCITELETQQEEKTKRIAAARLAKAKQLEEKQVSFGRSKIPSKKAFGKNVNLNKVDNDKVHVRKDKSSVKGKKLCKSVIKDVTQVDPKMRNVTIQNFDIVSTPESEEASDLDLVEYEKVITGCVKSFTVKSLNKLEKDDSSSPGSDDDDEEGALNQNIPRFQSGEKSAAAHRRKRSNYLKKRHSNFKKDNPVQTKDNPTDLTTNDTTLKNDIVSSDNNSSKKQKDKVQNKELNFSRNSFKDNIQKADGRHLKKYNNEDKFNKRAKRKNLKTSDNNDGVGLSSKSRPLILRSDEAKCSKRPDNKVVKNGSSSDDSIRVIKEVSLKRVDEVEPVDDGFKLKFEQTPNSSDNEINWKSVRETSVSFNEPDSDDEVDNDLMSIVRKHCKIVEDIPPIQRKDSSSSDFEAQFDSALQNFNKIK